MSGSSLSRSIERVGSIFAARGTTEADEREDETTGRLIARPIDSITNDQIMSANHPSPSQPSGSVPEPLILEQRLFSLIGKNVLELPAGFEVTADLGRVGLDSMALMQLLILIENHFDLMLTEADLSRENFTSIRSLAALIRERLLEKNR